jgi:hypothetical protein
MEIVRDDVVAEASSHEATPEDGSVKTPEGSIEEVKTVEGVEEFSPKASIAEFTEE